MKAVLLEKYGLPKTLNIGETEKPEPKPDQILVQVKAASLNALDKHLSSGMMLARPTTGLFKPKFGILGSDLAGIVEAVGEEITLFKRGDRVFGGRTWGAFAEYACLEEQKAAKIPEGVSFQEAAALPVAAGTALEGLRHGKLKAGQKVLVNGASGGVGTYLVQLARHFGAEVTAVCSGKNVSMVAELGAHHVVNYETDRVLDLTKRFDLLLDNVGNLSLHDCKKLTHEKGRAVIIGFSSVSNLFSLMIRGPLSSKKNGRQIGMLSTKVSRHDLEFLVDLVASGQLKSVIDKEYPLEGIREAMDYLWTRRVRSKLILNIGQ